VSFEKCGLAIEVFKKGLILKLAGYGLLKYCVPGNPIVHLCPISSIILII